MSTHLERITKLARENRETQFLSIAHYITPEALNEAFKALRKDAAAGIDGISHSEYQKNANEKIQKLHESISSGRYRTQPLKRIYIPKEDGKQRPISIPCLEDKIVQKAATTLLNAIYEVDFHKCSYGFRPGRSQHDALNEVFRRNRRGQVGWIIECDIQGYFDAIVRNKLMEMIERRIKDGSILRLIGKWINVGAIDEGRLLISETGTGQGQVISPLLANIYLHYVLDEWFESEVKPRLKGEAHEVRFADDFILLFQHKEDAERVMAVLGKRFAKYGLTLHPEKTRLFEFGPKALEESEKPGGKPLATFDFLGLTHVATRSRRGDFMVHVRTMKKRVRPTQDVVEIKNWS
jgi:group II intron reverse transcriptase/maturase